jgi:hypothetical protein
VLEEDQHGVVMTGRGAGDDLSGQHRGREAEQADGHAELTLER